MRTGRTVLLPLIAFAVLAFSSARIHAQAALLMEQPYGFFGALNPTGHNAIYFERICAETPVKLRRCEPGELGAVIARYQGIAGYDWVAIPLVPYLYSVETASEVPARVDRQTVLRMRNRYHEAHLLALGANLPSGGFVHGGWSELLGVAYERRVYAFRFDTTEAQDDAFIARMNSAGNQSQFDLLYSNCADFARVVLNSYFPQTFRRSIFPDAGMTTPKQLAWKLERYARKHPDTHLEIFEIPQVPGYRHNSGANKNIAESLSTTAYAIPIAIVNPYIAGGLFVDFLVRGHYRLLPSQPQVLTPDTLSALSVPLLTTSARLPQDFRSAGNQAPVAEDTGPSKTQAIQTDP
jgi:hypothetical protein